MNWNTSTLQDKISTAAKISLLIGAVLLALGSFVMWYQPGVMESIPPDQLQYRYAKGGAGFAFAMAALFKTPFWQRTGAFATLIGALLLMLAIVTLVLQKVMLNLRARK